MKDSRIGTYGAVALILLLMSKFLLISEIDVASIPLVIISAHALSRLNPVLLIFTSSYVSKDETSKSKPVGKKGSATTLIVAILFGLAPLCLIPLIYVPFLIIVQALVFFVLRYYVHKKVGGYTGDILGALQQFSEIAYYLCFIILSGIL